MKYLSLGIPKKQQGFTLIEFIVASMLSIIVLAAVGGTYFASRKINDIATARLSVHQDLRNAANMITRDARMAGGFGCFSMFGRDNKVIHDSQAKNPLLALTHTISTGSEATTVMQPIKSGSLGIAGFGDALMFVYGGGSASVTAYQNGSYTLSIPHNDPLSHPMNMPLTVSDCSRLSRLDSFEVQDNIFSHFKPEFDVAANRSAELAVLPLTINAYAVGSANGQQGLFRFTLGQNNRWQGPQLLIPDIKSMQIKYGYADCGGSASDINSQPSYRFSDTLLTNQMPSLISITLNQDLRAQGRSVEEDGERIDAGSITVYRINAAVRGGLLCQNQ